MINYFYLLNYSVVFSVIIALFRYKLIDKTFHPFIWLQVIAVLSEICSIELSKYYKSNAICTNIYTLIEYLMILWQFRRWKILNNNIVYNVLQTLMVIMWSGLLIYYKSIQQIFSISFIFSSFIIVLLSIHMLNRSIVSFTGKLLKNSTFLICCGFVVFFTFQIMVETFWIFQFSDSLLFASYIYLILSIVNFFVNIVYALAVLWIPRKQTFILPLSSPQS